MINLLCFGHFRRNLIGYVFCGLLGMFHEARIQQPELANVLPLDQKVDFYFDKHSGGAGEIASDWEEFADEQAEQIRSLYGTMPRFEDDEEFLPLQAADFFAWWVRLAYEDKGEHKRYREAIFGKATSENKTIPSIGFTFSEDQLVNALITRVRTGTYGVGPDVPIYDAKYHPRPAENPVRTLTSTQRSKVRRLRKKRP